MKFKWIVAIVGGFLCCNAFMTKSADIQKTAWLLGTWESKNAQGRLFETWRTVSSLEYAGISYRLDEKDTIILETIRLVQEPKGLFYIPTVKNQNGNLPVRFSLTTLSDSLLVFENPQHDFPQAISYKKKHADTLIAEVRGIINGQVRRLTVPMNRVK